MSQKAFTKGSKFPPLQAGKLRLYSMRFDPNSQRVRMVLEHKKIPYDVVNIALKEKADWFLERAPTGQVPTIEHDGKVLTDSLAICEYLDDVFPQNRLTPSDPYRRAQDRMLYEQYSKVKTAFFTLLSSKGEKKEAGDEFLTALDHFEKQLASRGEFFGGSSIAMIDILLWPWVERACVVKRLSDRELKADRHPKLVAWSKCMTALPAIKSTVLESDLHTRFLKTAFFDDNPQYDLGL